MAVFAYLFAFLVRKANGYVAVIITTLANGVLAPLTMVPFYGWAFFYGMLIPLLLGSLINIVMAYVVFKMIKKSGVDLDSKT